MNWRLIAAFACDADLRSVHSLTPVPDGDSYLLQALQVAAGQASYDSPGKQPVADVEQLLAAVHL